MNPLKEESGGQQVIRIYDPDGHLIEIGESLEHAEKSKKKVCKDGEKSCGYYEGRTGKTGIS